MNTSSFFRRLILLGTPIALGTLEMFHPVAITGDVLTDLGHRIPIWMIVHLLQLPLFGLMAVAVYLLSTIFAMHIPPTGSLGLIFFLIAAAGIELGQPPLKARELMDAADIVFSIDPPLKRKRSES